MYSGLLDTVLIELWQAIEVDKKRQRGRKESNFYRYLIGSPQYNLNLNLNLFDMSSTPFMLVNLSQSLLEIQAEQAHDQND